MDASPLLGFWILFHLVLSSCCSLNEDYFSHHIILDPSSKFHLRWTPFPTEIHFQIEAETKGYVAIGFSQSGGMRDADIFLGWIDDNGQIFGEDRYSTDYEAPILDSIQNYKILGGFENDTHTVIKFSRAWNTCDQYQDFVLGGDTIRLIWSYHSQDPQGTLDYHERTRRGSKSVYLKEKSLSISESLSKESEWKSWDIRANNLLLPGDDHTHYWCQIFKAPPEIQDRKHQMIGFEPIIQAGHENYVHHMVFYECHVKEGQTSDWFEQHVAKQGERCYSPNMPTEWNFCLATNTWAWAVGSEGEMFPENVGIPLGERFGGANYFMLETHYDNPNFHQDIRDNSGIRVFYTPTVREFDAAMILLGNEVNFLHMIPPHQESFGSVGRCVSECTKKSLPEGGIRILHGILHSHLAGRAIRLRHVRGTKELPIILKDDAFDFNYQASRKPEKEVLVLPGDELLLECDYRTTDRDKPTFGGLSTRKEMCLGFIYYYPRMELADCRSLPSLDMIMDALGIEEIYGEAFEKLSLFLKDIGSSQDEQTLQNLLQVLAQETGKKVRDFEPQTALEQTTLTEEDILKQPFYTVQSPDEDQSLHQIHLQKNYRNVILDMLMSLKIRLPERLQNQTLGAHLTNINWKDKKLAQVVQNKLLFGRHNCLCLAHGREPILEYKEVPYPQYESIPEEVENDGLCGHNIPRRSEVVPKPDVAEIANQKSRSPCSRLCSLKLTVVQLSLCLFLSKYLRL